MEPKSFDDLIDMGRVRKTVHIGDYEIVMHTLSSNEYAKMTERLGEDNVGMAKRLESLQREVVAAAIDTIDGKALSLEDKSKLVGMMQIGLSNMLYDEYSKMVEEQNSKLEEVKKKHAVKTTGSETSEKAPALK